MAAPETHPREHVETIKRLLEHYEEGFAFIKELVQNADDALKDSPKSGRLHLQWHLPPADSGFKNPLLQGPALLVVNDGPFTQKDRDGLMRMGMGSKAGDDDRIGRFGLGMKAVFHVCEAFFFLESGRDETLRELFCPWHPHQYMEWDTQRYPSDWEAMRTQVQNMVPNFEKWFAVWIPLRRREIVKNGDPIKNGDSAYPGDLNLCPPTLISAIDHQSPTLAEALIFLKNLRSVSFHDGKTLYEFAHDPEASRVSPGTRYHRIATPNQPELAEEWKAKPSWPKVFELTDNGGQSVPDKAKWEGAVAAAASKTEGVGSVRVFWNVFLPVGKRPAVDAPLQSFGWKLNIFLHGYFFLNEDRTSVYGTPDGFREAGEDDPKRIKIAWNKALATSSNGLLPMVPKALQKCFTEESFSNDQIKAVITCLKTSEWFRIYRQHVCQTHSLVRNLDTGVWKWRLVESANYRLVFPRFDDPVGSATEGIVARLVGDGCQERVILIEGTTALASSDLPVVWTAADLKWLCGALQRDVLANRHEVRVYLAKLFTRLSELDTTNPEVWNDLPVYEVESLNGAKTFVSAKTLQGDANQVTLFANSDAALKDCLNNACPHTKAWFVVGTKPPGLSPPEFGQVTVAKLVLKQEHLGLSSHRSVLIGKLLSEASNPTVKSAIRYLLHVSFDHCNTDGALFVSVGGNDSASKWNEVIKTALEHKGESWRLVDATFAAGINDQQKGFLDLKMCGVDAFRSLCKEADKAVGELPLHPFHEFLLTHLNDGTHSDPDADNKLLRTLSIHCHGDNLFTSVEESVWLAPETGTALSNDLLQIWEKLSTNAKIVRRSRNNTVVLRQQELFKERVLNPNGIIRLACQQDRPQDFAMLIVHHLSLLGTPEKETSDCLKKAPWLPLTDGRNTKLSNLLWIEGADDQIQRMTHYRVHDSCVVTRAEIALDLTEAWSALKYSRPNEDETLGLLKTAFGRIPKLHFGLSKMSSADELGAWLKAVDGCEADISPAVPLIRAFWPTKQKGEAEGKRTWAVKVAAIFAREWSGEDAVRCDTALEALRNRHQESDIETRDVIIRVFHDYLAAAVRGGRWDGEYRSDTDFTLLNQLGAWTPVSQLVIPIAGIARRALADERAIRALGFASKAEADDPLPGAIIGQAMDDGALAALLRDYGATISEQLSVKLWGIFVALLGETPTLRALADELTGGRTETIRDELCGPICAGINPRQRVIDCRFSCQITDGDTAEVVALTGDYFDAPLDMDQAAFLVAQSDAGQGQWWINRFFVNQQRDGAHFAFRLCAPQTFVAANSPQMFERLERTVIQLLQEVLHVSNDRLRKVKPLMEKLMGLGQLSLGRAQQEIIATAQIHLSQLGIRPQQGTPLALAIKRLDEATSLESQAREEHEQQIGDPDRNEKEAKKARDEGLRQLREILQTDGNVHRDLSAAMKTRIGREQYVPESIPFELFQNADDALAQLAGNEEAPRIFVMEIQNAALRFAHWGRAINHPDEAKGELKRSYERDLVKMLILHGSDKQVGDDDAAVTGKFGLGFKSVYLITDNPQVVSGDLSFDVAGAIYPRRLDKDQIDRLRDRLHNLMPGQKGGTFIEIPTAVKTGSLAQKFAALAPYLVIFAREIRELRLRGVIEFSHHWQPEKVQDGEGWELCLGDAGSAGKLMELKCGNISWLFGLDQHGVRKLPEIPCIWATAPLHSTGEVGFAINGPFDPDPGRTELGKGEAADRRNAELFHEASKGLYLFLKWCVECDDLCGTLGLSHGTTASFWASLWTLFSSLPSSAKDMSARLRVATSVWPKENESGYAGAARTSPVIPNGLPMGFEALTSIDQVCFETSGYLASPVGQDLLSAVGGWQEWTEMERELRMTSENVISAKVAEVLKRQVADFKTESFSLSFLIRRLAGKNGRVTAALSARLSQFLKPTVWTDGYNWPREEKLALEEFLAGLQFQNESGEWVTPMGLLIVDGTGFEAGRAAFASSDRRLNQQYSANNALDFFRLCRVDMKVTAEDLAEWIRQSLANQDEERVSASLLFLASTTDDYASHVAGFLCAETRRSLTEHPAFALLSDENQNRVRGAFQLADMSEARREGIEYSPQDNAFPNEWPFDDEGADVPPLTLQELVDRWNGHEGDAVQQFTVSGIYRDLVFPDVGQSADLGALLLNTDTLIGKEHWYRLLCLGCSMSIPLGRNPAARIIPFWRDRLNAEFWAATIPTTLEEAKSTGYDQKLDAFFEAIIHQSFRDENASGEDADFWRRVFYDFRKMHFYVFRNDLPAVLLQLANANDVEGSALISFLRSGQIPVAMQMPGIESWTGVIGQSMSAPLLFVMRELRRLNVLPPDRFDNACFYMNSPARRVAHRLRWISDEQRRDYSLGNLVSLSERIFDEVSQCEYAEELLSHFDLPLQWYASQNLR